MRSPLFGKPDQFDPKFCLYCLPVSFENPWVFYAQWDIASSTILKLKTSKSPAPF